MRNALVSALLVAIILSCSQTPEQQMQSLLAAAIEQIDACHFEKAEATIAKMGELDSSSPLIPYCRGLIDERRLCYQDAVHEYMLVGEVDPEFGPALEGLCRSYSRLGEYAGATRTASKYVQHQPDDRAVRILAARAKIGLGQYRGAEKEIDRAVELGASRATANLIRARLYYLQNEIDTARSLREQAMADAEETPEFLSNAADLYETVGLMDSAIVFSRRVIKASSDDHVALMDHFFRCLRGRYFQDVRRAIAQVDSADGGAVVRCGMWVRYYRATGEHSKARPLATQYRGLTNESVMSVSLDILARAESSDFMSAGNDLSVLQGLLKNGSYLPEFADYMVYVLQVNHPKLASGEENLDALRQMPAEYANGLDTKLRIAYLMHKIGDFDGYKEYVSLLEDYHRSQPDWLTGIADVNAEPIIMKYDQAERLYTRALELNHWYRPAFENMVAMYRSLRRYPDALQLFEEYPHFAEQYPEVGLLEALALIENERYDEAQTMLINGYKLTSGDVTIVAEYLKLLRSFGQMERIDPIVDLLAVAGANSDALTLAATWQCERRNFKEALELAERSLADDEGYYDAYAVKAWAIHGLGRTGEAFDLFEENRTRDRDNVANNVYYSMLLAGDKIDLERASGFAREAVFDGLGDLEVWMNLCYVYYQAERFDLATGEARKAARTFSTRPEPYYWLGLSMAASGRPEARENLQKSILLGLAGEQLDKANEVMAGL